MMFMDERLAHPKEPKASQATVLTCLLVDPDHHEIFRVGFYGLVKDALGVKANTVPVLPEIHGMNLFPEATDADRETFLNGLVSIATELRFRIIRIGYRNNRHRVTQNNDERQVLGLCFMSVRFCVQEQEPSAVVWPIMELDRRYAFQDRHFASASSNLDWATHLIGRKNMSIDNSHFGEVLYHTKQSAYGAMVDCFSYLLHLKFRRDVGEELSPFKSRLIQIADRMNPTIGYDEVIDIGWGTPPADYVATGPVRWMYPITPADPA